MRTCPRWILHGETVNLISAIAASNNCFIIPKKQILFSRSLNKETCRIDYFQLNCVSVSLAVLWNVQSFLKILKGSSMDRECNGFQVSDYENNPPYNPILLCNSQRMAQLISVFIKYGIGMIICIILLIDRSNNYPSTKIVLVYIGRVGTVPTKKCLNLSLAPPHLIPRIPVSSPLIRPKFYILPLVLFSNFTGPPMLEEQEVLIITEAYLGPCQTSVMEFFTKMFNGFQL